MEKYEIDANIKNHIDTKSCGYVPSWYIPINARNNPEIIKNDNPFISILFLLFIIIIDENKNNKIPVIIIP